MSTHSPPTRFIPLCLLLPCALCCLGATPWYGIVAAPSCPQHEQGVCIETVVRTSAAHKAGLQAGDRIIATTKDAPIQDVTAFRMALRAHPSSLPLRYLRGGKPHDVTLTPLPLPSQDSLLRRHALGHPLPKKATLKELRPDSTPLQPLQAPENSWILLDFWATWCTPCRAYTPTLESLAKHHKNDLQVWSISAEPLAHLRQTLTPLPSSIRHFHDPEGRLHQRLLIREYPVMILVDPGGIVRKIFTGDHPPAHITATIKGVLPGVGSR